MGGFNAPDVKEKSFLDIIREANATKITPKYDWISVLTDYDKREDQKFNLEFDFEEPNNAEVGTTTENPENIEIDYEFSSPYKKQFYKYFTSDNRPQLSDSTAPNNDMGYRNNNPGNLRKHKGWEGDVSDKGFKVFNTIEEGVDALRSDINVKVSGESDHMPNTTKVKDFFHIYAPFGDGDNDPVKYAKHVVDFTGLDPEMEIKDMTDEHKEALIKGIVRVESPNSYIYLYEPQKRDELLASVIKETKPKFKGGGILYKLFNRKHY